MINAFRGDKRLLRWQKKGVGKGEFFPPCTGRDVFPLPVVFAFSVFCLYLAPQAERSVLLPRLYLLLIFCAFGGYKGVLPPYSYFCFFFCLYVFVFSGGL